MANNSARYQLLGQGGRGHGLGSGGMSGWGDNSDEEPDHTRDMSVPQIKQQQYQALEEQDRGLEALSHVITRQKTLAQAIGTEVDYQNELIEDITDHVDRTRDRIHGETQRVRTIDRKDNTCGYWTVILTLLVIIIIIVAL
ncbi:syntaxin-8 [Folsomia candida]|uniref:Syntaxin-8 n=1 Tax=Folsomia candida TaxID=158441 RepID=A0A226F4M0_FOLCA|nr:syntaxin-8 [Folsomia candida]OXA63866.1 Syntaxin-8 [Folsomia candida]